MSVSFRVNLNSFRGPLDLLLYLVKKHEVDVLDIPIAMITDQYLAYLVVLEQLDVNAVGDFLELASTLIEIKSRMVLPRVEEEEETWDDPREELVERLLEYKKYKDVASILEEQGREFQQSYHRIADDLPVRRVAPAEQPIREVELWDLVSALGRIIQHGDAAPESSIVYDDTPMHVHIQTIYDGLLEKGEMRLSELLMSGMHKSRVIGVFLAMLELVRHHSVEAEQDENSIEIIVRPGPNFSHTLDLSDVDDYGDPQDMADSA